METVFNHDYIKKIFIRYSSCKLEDIEIDDVNYSISVSNIGYFNPNALGMPTRTTKWADDGNSIISIYKWSFSEFLQSYSRFQNANKI
jgi:hypothetical protein